MDFAGFYGFFEDMFHIFNSNHSIVFQDFYQLGGYNHMFFIMLGTPLVFILLFYFLWKYPYATIVHWLIYIGAIAVVAAVLTYSSVRLDLAGHLISPDPEISDFTNSLVVKFVMLNAVLALIVSFLYSLILQRFSKVQMHLPF